MWWNFCGFNWEVKINNVNKVHRNNQIKEVNVDRVAGLYCKNKFGTKECSRTLFGRLKCPDPECSSKIIKSTLCLLVYYIFSTLYL